MSGITKRNAVLLAVLLMMVVTAPAQTREREALSVQGYPGETTVIQFQGRTFVDVQELARITNGSIRFENRRTILTLGDASATVGENTNKPGFSRPFMSAAIEAMASIREWGGMLLITVQNGYPVGNNMAGNTIAAYQGRAADAVALAAAAASNDSDSRGLELLRNEFDNGQGWAERFVHARSTLSAANMTITEHAFENDEDAQKIIRCGQFLAQMFASGTFQDDASCH